MLNIIGSCWKTLLGISLAMTLFTRMGSLLLPAGAQQQPGPAIAIALTELLFYPIFYGLAILVMDRAKTDKLTFADTKNLLRQIPKIYGPLLKFSFHFFLILGLGIVLLLIPAILFHYRYCFGPFLVTLRRQSASGAFAESRQLTRNFRGSIVAVSICQFTTLPLTIYTQKVENGDIRFLLELSQNTMTMLITVFLFTLFLKVSKLPNSTLPHTQT